MTDTKPYTLKEITDTKTYTLGDYDLKPGDWVKLDGSWLQFNCKGPLFQNNPHYFMERGNEPYFSHYAVEAVLRPSEMIRDTIDELLKMTNIWGSGILQIKFNIVLPRQNAEKKEKLPSSYYETASKQLFDYSNVPTPPDFTSLIKRMEALEEASESIKGSLRYYDLLYKKLLRLYENKKEDKKENKTT